MNVFETDFATFQARHNEFKAKRDVVDHPFRYYETMGEYVLFWTDVDHQVLMTVVRKTSMDSIARENFFNTYIRLGTRLVSLPIAPPTLLVADADSLDELPPSIYKKEDADETSTVAPEF